MSSSLIPGNWELVSLLCKFFLYFGVASIAGGSYCLWQFCDGRRQSVQRLLTYIMCGTLVGFQAVLVNFFVQVGQLNSSGIMGMFDWGMASILLDTTLGETTFVRLGAFVWALLATVMYFRKTSLSTAPFSSTDYQKLFLVYAMPLVLLAFTFSSIGHVSVLGPLSRLSIVLHVTAFAFWIGALYPLLLLSQSTDVVMLQRAMKRFGDFATGIVTLLLVAGVFLGFQLFGAVSELYTTRYGMGFLLKLLLVLGLLGIAAINKLYLVPRLCELDGPRNLGKSIRIETVVAMLVLVVTTYFTTVVGPVTL